MIAFAKEAPDPDDRPPRPIPIACPQVTTQQAIDTVTPEKAELGAAASIGADAAREQRELAMLQRALAHCGLL